MKLRQFVFDDGIDIPGSDIKELSNIASAFSCQQECQKNPACVTFAFNLDVKHCWLKNKYPAKYSHAATISGPQKCLSGMFFIKRQYCLNNLDYSFSKQFNNISAI